MLGRGCVEKVERDRREMERETMGEMGGEREEVMGVAAGSF